MISQNLISHHLFDLAVWQLLQVSIAIALVGLITRGFCRRRPQLAYALWLLVLIKSLTPPIWQSPTGIFSWAGLHQNEIAPATSVAPPNSGVDPLATPIGLPQVQFQREAPVIDSPYTVAEPWQALLAVWAGGCVAVLIALGFHIRLLASKISKLSVPPPKRLTESLESACKTLSLRQPRMRVCTAPIGPAIFGILRPTLVIPASVVADNSPAQLRIILMHELLHLHRRDPLVAGVQLLSQAIWWFNPLLWWMNRLINQTREMCCDGQAIQKLRCPPAEYAQLLIDVLRQRRTFVPVPMSLGIRSAQVTERRLDQIMNSPGDSSRRLSWRNWLWVTISALLLLPGAGILSHTAAAVDGKSSSAPSTQPSLSNKAIYDYLGDPVPAPVDMNPLYTKEGLTAAMQHAAQDANVSLQKLEIDESEFPYLVGVVVEKGQMRKLDASIQKLPGFEYRGGVNSNTVQVMNLVPYQAYPRHVGDRIEHRVDVRMEMLYDKIITEPMESAPATQPSGL